MRPHSPRRFGRVSPAGGNKQGAGLVGEFVAKRALEKGIKKVVFDRNGFLVSRPGQGSCRFGSTARAGVLDLSRRSFFLIDQTAEEEKSIV